MNVYRNIVTTIIYPLGICTAAGLVQLLLWDYCKPFTWMFFYPAVFLSSQVAGFRGAIVSLFSSLLFGLIFFSDSLFPLSVPVILSVLVFILLALILGAEQRRFHTLLNTLTEKAAASRRTYQELAAKYERAKLVAERLQKDDRVRNEFVDKNIGALKLTISLIRQSVQKLIPLDSNHSETMAVILNNTRHADRCINDLFEVASLAAGTLRVKTVTCNLSDIMHEVSDGFYNYARKRHVAFTHATIENLYCLADESHCYRILLNLLTDSFEKVAENGIIAFSAAKKDGRIVVSLSDSRSAELSSRYIEMYNPTSLADLSYPGFQKYTGKDLRPVFELIRSNNGNFTIKRGDYGGIAINISFPESAPGEEETIVKEQNKERVLQYIEDLQKKQLTDAESKPESTPKLFTILLIEPDRDISGYFTMLLKEQFNVKIARTGRSGLEMVLLDKPHLVITNCDLPELDAVNMVTEIRKHKIVNNIPVIAIHNSNMKTCSRQLLGLGILDVFPVSVEPVLLIAHIKRLLSHDGSAALMQHQHNLLMTEVFNAIHEVIFIRNGNGVIEFINNAGCTLFGIEPEQIIGKPVDLIASAVPGGFQQMINLNNDSSDKMTVKVSEADLQTVHGLKSFLVTRIPVISPGGVLDGLVEVALDVSGYKSVERQLRLALRDKEAALEELVHRANNNMQIIRGILNLYIPTTTVNSTRAVLKEIDNRIQVMSILHQKLSEGKNVNLVYLNEYLADVLSLLKKRYQVADVHVQLDFREVQTLVDYAGPCGILFFEAVSNIFKHAFPENRQGKVLISLIRLANNNIRLVIKDDGIGFPEGFNPNETETIGMTFIHAIALEQLKGELQLKSDNGVVVSVVFQDNQYSGRV